MLTDSNRQSLQMKCVSHYTKRPNKKGVLSSQTAHPVQTHNKTRQNSYYIYLLFSIFNSQYDILIKMQDSPSINDVKMMLKTYIGLSLNIALYSMTTIHANTSNERMNNVILIIITLVVRTARIRIKG